MEVINYTDLRANLAKTMDKVCDDHSPVVVTRQNNRSIVMMSLEDYQELDETAFLLRSPKNAKRLRKSIEEFERGETIEGKLIE